MPAASRWMIRCSFVYLILGFALGALLLIHKAYPLHPAMWMVLPIHIELLIFGWIVQLTLGTAYWILPRYMEGEPRGSSTAAAFIVILLNLGIWLVIAKSLQISDMSLALAGRVLETGAVILFVLLHWKRVTTYRNK